MNQLLYNVCVVCYANYCRSPVAERLLQKKLGSKYKVISAGINPIYIGGMDKRSISYLEKKGLSNTLHTPKKINLKIVKNSSYIFCLDHEILMILNKLFPTYKKKLILLNYKNPQIRLADPYKFNQDEYLEIMENISKAIDLI